MPIDWDRVAALCLRKSVEQQEKWAGYHSGPKTPPVPPPSAETSDEETAHSTGESSYGRKAADGPKVVAPIRKPVVVKTIAKSTRPQVVEPWYNPLISRKGRIPPMPPAPPVRRDA